MAQLVRAIKGDPLDDAEPGVVRSEVSFKQLTNPFLDLIDKEVLPFDRPILPAPDRSGSTANAPNRIFLSYPSKDRGFAACLRTLFADRLPGVRVRDRLLEPPLRVFSQTIAREFGEEDVFIPVLSPEYMQNPATIAELDEATLLVVSGQGRLVPIVRRQCKPTGLAGILEAADFTDPAKDTSSMEDLISGVLGSTSAHTEPGEVRAGLTIEDIGKAATEINRLSRRRQRVELKLELTKLKPEERATIERDIVAEIDAAIVDIHEGIYDQDLEREGIETSKEELPAGSPWRIPTGQQLTGVEIALITLVAKEGIKVTDKVLSDLWDKIIFPRIRQRWGSRVSKAQK